ncbi:MAG: hypothetical protein ABI542_07665 [Gemmatimonadota bacterium]
MPKATPGPLITVLISACLAGATTLSAQLPGLGFGMSAGAQMVTPSGDFGDATETGYGAYLSARLTALVIGAAGTLEVTRFGGSHSTTVLGARVGPRLAAGPLKLGFDIGRYTEIDRTGYTPNISLALGPLEAGAGYTFFSGGRWLSLSGGLRF